MSSTCDLMQDVVDFHEIILDVYAPSTPTLRSSEYCVERTRFLAEELTEFSDAAAKGDLVGVSDALADIVYVALGTAHMMGLPFEDIWRAVQSANMNKRRGITKRGNAIDAVKPEGWVGPEAAIARALGRKLEA